MMPTPRETAAEPSSLALATHAVEERIGERLLGIVRDLAEELQPGRASRLVITLDSRLDRDLGFDSLGRAELLLRLDQAFAANLPDSLIGDAETPRDFVPALAKAGGTRAMPAAAVAAPTMPLPQAIEPATAVTLLDVLSAHVRERRERPHIRLWLGEEDERVITYDALYRHARAVAAGLIDRRVSPGERIAIMLPTGADFFETFFGVLMAGAIPVPIYPPSRRTQVEDHLRRQAGILRNAAASLLVTDHEIRPLAGLLLGLADDLRGVVTAAELHGSGILPQPLPTTAEATALIQYTSGSTGDPKGVVLSHANLLANIRAMGEALEVDSRDVFVSWLPLYHDMGLIGAWLGCLYYGIPVTILPPLSFLARPLRWLSVMSRHRATLSVAPNFAFELCLKAMGDKDLPGLDLGSLRAVLNGAEPVSPDTQRRFTERFGKYGFRAEAMAPVYGLAECSVGLAFPPLGRRPIVDRIGRDPLTTSGRCLPAAADDAGAVEFVACGRPLPGHEIRIVDDGGRELPDRRQGRLQFKGPSATKGYFRNDAKTKALFDGEWLESGDLAYIADGDIFVTGRIKDMIIRAGRNLYPQELEEVVGGIAGVRQGCVAAFAVRDDRSGTERLVVIAETRLVDEAKLADLRARIVEASLTILDAPPDDVALVPPRAVPKTSSGKIRRSAARALYESGAVAEGGRALWRQLVRVALAGAFGRVRRTLEGAGSLGYGAYWWSMLVLTAAVAWPLVAVLPVRAWRHAVVAAAARGFLRAVGIRLAVGGEPCVPDGGAMIVANHASYLDGLVVTAAIPHQLSFVAKDELRRQWIAGIFLRRLGTIFVRRTDPKGAIEDTEAMLAAVRQGACAVTFPEGTFTRMPGLLGFRLGAFRVAAQAGVPVVPVTIRGTRAILRGDQWLPRRADIAVHVGEPAVAESAEFAAALRLRGRVRSAMLERCGEPDLARERVELPQD
jgi:1-acyl-sn-glycerol-3-phosphate acyltransferase